MRYFAVILALALVLSGCAGAPVEPTVPATETTPAEALPLAPDIMLYQLDGSTVKLSDFQGKPVVLNFWASWCGPCKMEMPDFQEKYEELGDQVQFLMVNMTDGVQETVDDATLFIQGAGYTFPVLYDMDLEGAYAYGVQSIPRTYFIDADGYAVAMADRAIDGETLQMGIDMILP